MVFALAHAAIYLVLLGIVLQRRSRRNPAEIWLLAYIAYSVVLMAAHGAVLGGYVSDVGLLTGQALTIAGFVFSVALVGLLTIAYLGLDRHVMIGAAVLAGIWAAVMLVAYAGQFAPVVIPGAEMQRLFGAGFGLSVEIAMLGWLLYTVALFAFTWHNFLSEPLPLYANRILFWALVAPALLAGDLFSAWLHTPWNYVGYVLRVLGAIGAVYSVVAHRVMDLRDAGRWIVSRTILVLFGGMLVFGAIAVALTIHIPQLGTANTWVVGILAALAVGILFPLVVRFWGWLLGNLINRGITDVAEAVRRYSQRINSVIDLRQLGDTAVRTIGELLRTRRGQLILVTQVSSQLMLEKIGADSPDGTEAGSLTLTSPIYLTLMRTRRPVLQYDLDYHRDYIAAPEDERRYFAQLEMDIYAPIITEDQLIGLLAVGPKINDDPFRAQEIELLDALANQTVVALANARLVDDLRSLNQRISALNEDLRTTNDRLQLLNSVKTDFIAIASHELRTPLTQIQGYADLMLEMANRRLLDPDEMISVTGSLSKASQRMAEVISSLLDVSQIDVESMDLNFVETSLSSVLKLAVEPYADSIHDRNLTLVARGLRNLPSIQGDYKRLVQVFQNLITNAIKFTPDGGKIDVIGEVWERDDTGQPTSVRITVRDNGIGIDKEHQGLIFEKFYRVGSVALHSTGSTKYKGAGPGLGLPIARGIIDAHGGRIWVESVGNDEEKMPGSAFYVVLPIKSPVANAQKRIHEIGDSKQETIAGPAGSLLEE